MGRLSEPSPGGTSEVLVCPACRAALGANSRAPGAKIGCSQCGQTFPLLGRIPLLLQHPEATLATWRAGLAAFAAETQAIEHHLWAELATARLPGATRRRLRKVAEAMPEHRALVLELFAEVGLEPEPGAAPSIAGPRGGWSPLDYVTLIHRDFGWGPKADEVTPALDQLLSVLPPDFRLGRTLVFGAGTARLAWDLALYLDPLAEITSVDKNPLPLLVTQRLLAGRETVLYELPGHPRSAEDAAARRTLRAPGPPPQNLELLFADALHPPVGPESFDTVVTPWFVDQVPRDLATFLPELGRVLRPGGAWLHTGPFVYDPAHTKPAHRYGIDEFFELAQESGFRITRHDHAPAPYLCSPLSGQGRREWVLALHAVKKGSPRVSAEPRWLEPTWTAAIPQLVLKTGAQLPLPILERVLALIDGQRTLQDILTVLLAEGALADDGNAEAAVRGCLRVLAKAAR